jgi:hypothetical protein
LPACPSERDEKESLFLFFVFSCNFSPFFTFQKTFFSFHDNQSLASGPPFPVPPAAAAAAAEALSLACCFLTALP